MEGREALKTAKSRAADEVTTPFYYERGDLKARGAI